MNLTFICIILYFGWQYAAGSPITASEYVVEDAWLRLHIVPATWSDAAVRCQLEGGVLASPTTVAMMQAMQLAMNKNNYLRNSYTGVFIGVTDLFSKGDFKSLDGSGLDDHLDWAVGEPNNAGDSEDCLAMTSKGTLADVSCAKVLPYFCRKSTRTCPSNPVAEEPTDLNTSVDDITNVIPLVTRCGSTGYNWEPRTSSCYKFHSASKSWRKALSTCHSEGGHLAIINSRTESSVLGEIYKEYVTSITGAEEDRHAFIGFRKFDDGEWTTIYGETLAEAGFEGWDEQEPSNGSGYKNSPKESCGSIHWNGLLNDAPCVQICPFICEMAPKYV